MTSLSRRRRERNRHVEMKRRVAREAAAAPAQKAGVAARIRCFRERGILDIHEAPVRMPETVFIVGSGPRGKAHYRDIPADAYVIVLNRAVMIPFDLKVPWKPSAWIVIDWRACEKDWWAEADRLADCIRIFSCGTGQRSAAYQGATPETAAGRLFVFEHVPLDTVRRRFEPPPERRVRPDGTVAGAAMWIAQLLGARETVLVGVDMGGDADYAGSLPADRRHGTRWSACSRLELQIEWQRRHGIVVSSMSPTRLRNVARWKPAAAIAPEPAPVPAACPGDTCLSWTDLMDRSDIRVECPDRLPTVAYLTMAFDPMFTMNTVISAVEQNYPHHLKTLYLMHQEPFPPPFSTDLPVMVREAHIAGRWPELWLFKLMEFFAMVIEDVIVVFDEDDRYESDYTTRAITPLVTGRARLAWNYDMVIAKRASLRHEPYRSPIGTLAGERRVLDQAARLLWKRVHKAEWPAGRDNIPSPYGGAKDARFRDLLLELHGDRIAEHDGLRYYFVHSRTNTTGKRPEIENVDYDTVHRGAGRRRP